MYNYEFCEKFTPYLDPDTFEDGDGNTIDWKNRSLIKNAPQSAIDAFNEFKRIEKEAEKDDIDI